MMRPDALFAAELAVEVLKNFPLTNVQGAVVGERRAIRHEHHVSNLYILNRNIHRAETLGLINVGKQIHSVLPPAVRAGVVGKEDAGVDLEPVAHERPAILLACHVLTPDEGVNNEPRAVHLALAVLTN